MAIPQNSCEDMVQRSLGHIFATKRAALQEHMFSPLFRSIATRWEQS